MHWSRLLRLSPLFLEVYPWLEMEQPNNQIMKKSLYIREKLGGGVKYKHMCSCSWGFKFAVILWNKIWLMLMVWCKCYQIHKLLPFIFFSFVCYCIFCVDFFLTYLPCIRWKPCYIHYGNLVWVSWCSWSCWWYWYTIFY